MAKNPCIVMVPSPGLSHLIPLVEFAKRLIHENQDFHVKILIPTLGPPASSTISILNTLPPNIGFTILPQVNAEDISNGISQPATLMQLTVKHSLPSLHEELTSLSSKYRLVALLLSLFSADALDLAKEFNMLSYIFFASGATFLSFCLHLPKLDDESFPSHETVQVPGCPVPFKFKDLPDPVLEERSSKVYQSFLGVCQRYSLADGFIVNTFTCLEGDVIRAIQQEQRNNSRKESPLIYPIGPMIQTESSNTSNRLECVTWLDKQQPGSVLYISLGSGGTLSHDKLNEMAFGLEQSGHKFLWVLRAPSNYGGSAYLGGKSEDPMKYLPPGFVERTKGQGLVVPNWAPQIEVLGHGSTGGFLTHCGWNSVLESVVHGVPLIAWPLFAEQGMNAVFLTRVAKVAVRARQVEVDDGKGDKGMVVTRDEIADAIKRMMGESDEGLGIRKRMKELSDAAADAITTQDGSSRKALSILALKWHNFSLS